MRQGEGHLENTVKCRHVVVPLVQPPLLLGKLGCSEISVIAGKRVRKDGLIQHAGVRRALSLGVSRKGREPSARRFRCRGAINISHRY